LWHVEQYGRCLWLMATGFQARTRA
jgi:hypothetical protein